MSESASIVVVGGGIVGLSTAMALAERGHGGVMVIEAEGRVAFHQTGRNSGVVHSGLYYKPGSAKALLCAQGREYLYDFCAAEGVAHDRCGKVVVAVEEREILALDELERRGLANGLEGISRLDPQGIREREPHARGVAGLWVPQTGIVDYRGVCEAMARRITAQGGRIRLNSALKGCRRDGAGWLLETSAGPVRCGFLVNCAGLQSDRVARLCGADPGARIIPFRGEYYDLVPEARHLVRNLIYPVPDPRFPFLGVHFTRMVLGGVEAGPNAVLAFRREGYRFFDFSLRDLWETVSWPGFRVMAWNHWRMGLAEMWRSLSKAAFHRALARLIPEIRMEDIRRAGAGVRAQAMDRSGKLLDDFHVVAGAGMVHVLNAPSPAATASISIGRKIADMVEGKEDAVNRPAPPS